MHVVDAYYMDYSNGPRVLTIGDRIDIAQSELRGAICRMRRWRY
ncbi:hypothetical protein Mnod_1574 [Methylobacterium nodulans ORS 2060]|uniref:Uncharacterized protein n=1 Tax=Methylobacterium nodulans (strain LMG 21967 / CNCM I-2342 / ORS 2060) TaxID=460265 RepID=B8IPR6_METNO|nr:hypothetical protein Mnod_1574 [Methylobacterium nodulans ORS 2060]